MWQYKSTLNRVIDGDTVDLDIDLGFKLYAKIRIRLLAIDTPERGQDGFDEATQFVKDWFHIRNNECIVDTISTGKYGRWLGTISDTHDPMGVELSLNRALLKSGHAKPYGT